jgi:PadR family transcriptional regulator PadR
LSALVLLDEQPTHGYRLLERLAEAGHADVTGGTLYPLLARLGDKGWTEYRWEHDGSGPGRKVFSVTEAGREHLDVLLREWGDVSRMLDALVSHRRRGTA